MTPDGKPAGNKIILQIPLEAPVIVEEPKLQTEIPVIVD